MRPLRIARAISAAEREPGSEVYFPPGRYLLDQRSSRLFTFVIDRRIELVGAGIDRSELINEVGAKTPGVKLSRDMFAIEVAPGTQVGGGSGSVIADMTLDSASYDAGTDVMDFANHTTLAHLRVDAASSSNRYNPNCSIFPMHMCPSCLGCVLPWCSHCRDTSYPVSHWIGSGFPQQFRSPVDQGGL